MDLIDRYLHAVRRNLPAAKADDIVAELRDELLARVEDREAALGRRMTKAETSALLKEYGHPLVVASRYRPHQHLIGPATFPFYVFVLRIVLLIVAAVIIAAAVVPALFGSESAMRAVVQGLGGAVGSLVTAFAIVTIVFAVLERSGFPADHLAKWTPEHLPDVRIKQPGTWESAIEVALGIAAILWWTGVIVIPNLTQNDKFRFDPDPVFLRLYWPILALMAARLLYNLIRWLRPRWRVLQLVIGGATVIGGLAILSLLYQTGHWIQVTPFAMSAQETADLDRAINMGIQIALIVVAIVWTLGALGTAWQLFRDRARQN